MSTHLDNLSVNVAIMWRCVHWICNQDGQKSKQSLYIFILKTKKKCRQCFKVSLETYTISFRVFC